MSAITDVLRAVKDVLLLQSQIERMEEQIAAQNARVERLADSITGMDKRLVRIETMIEMTARGLQPPQIGN